MTSTTHKVVIRHSGRAYELLPWRVEVYRLHDNQFVDSNITETKWGAKRWAKRTVKNDIAGLYAELAHLSRNPEVFEL